MINWDRENNSLLKEILNEIKSKNEVINIGTLSDESVELVVKTPDGLMWDKNDSDKEMTFAEAEEYCKNLRLGGFSDWRMPSREELLTIVDLTKYNPAIKDGFNTKSSSYWTSTPYAGCSGSDWVVSFGGGGVYYSSRSSNYYVRPVRQSS